MTEEMLIRHCAPTLAGLKTGSMFPCPLTSRRELLEDIRGWTRRLVPRGLRVLPLRCSETQALIYVFRPKNLKRDLTDQMTISLLKGRGYPDAQMESCLCRLIDRFQAGGEFPHEVGLFLGYPPEDVSGFIEKKACGHKCVGCWKVYGDAAAAKRTFDQYKRCTKIYCSQWKQGMPIERLTVSG